MIRRALGALAWLWLGVGLALAARAAIAHDAARARWSAEAARLGSADYDRAASERHYAAALADRDAASRVSWITAPAWLLWFLSRRGGAAGPRHAGRRAHGAALADGAVTAALVGVSFAIEGWLGADRAGWGALAGPQLVGVAVGHAWGGLATGSSIGARSLRVTVCDAAGRPAGALRGLAALALGPIALPWSLVSLARGASGAPVHLSWTGLEVRDRPDG
ncbi:MAG: hypothetical protein KF729_16665 [Sandaracinaceae bacterium]|nr:hypothetical protein [Sandaracinaceae bacterium]